MKRTQRVVTFLVSVSMLMTTAASPNVVYASSAASGHQDPPRVATKTQAIAAFMNGAPFLGSLADEHRDANTRNLYVDVFNLHNLRTNDVLWSWGWCTKTAWQLEENWNKIKLTYEVDGKSVGLHNFSTRDWDDEIDVLGHGLQTGKCRMSYGALYDWPAGDHELTVEAYFNADVNDGWDVYPAGTRFETVYRVNVPQSMGDPPPPPVEIPTIATRSQAEDARRNGSPDIWTLATAIAPPNSNVNELEVRDLRANDVLWSWVWCTKTAGQLEENWNKIKLTYEVDGKSVGLQNFSTHDWDDEFEIPGRGTVQGKCRMNYGALYDWPAGDHELTVKASSNADVNDGWDIYPAGTISKYVYRVTVPRIVDPDETKPVGIEHLGDANYACYYIQGSNGYQLAAQMDKLSLEDDEGIHWAWAKIEEMNYSGGACYADGTADLSGFKVNLTNLITMPCWYPPAGTSKAEIAKFDYLMWRVARHELRHTEINDQYARILEQRLKNSNTCDDATWSAIQKQAGEEMNAAHEAFHASPEGQPMRYP